LPIWICFYTHAHTHTHTRECIQQINRIRKIVNVFYYHYHLNKNKKELIRVSESNRAGSFNRFKIASLKCMQTNVYEIIKISNLNVRIKITKTVTSSSSSKLILNVIKLIKFRLFHKFKYMLCTLLLGVILAAN